LGPKTDFCQQQESHGSFMELNQVHTLLTVYQVIWV
jgi:hypothetical protein